MMRSSNRNTVFNFAMTKQQQAIEILLANGWEAAGHTQSDTVRVPTSRSPVYGGAGGELRTFGGRPRFTKGDRRATVGVRTTCFYEYKDKQNGNFQNVPTKDLDKIKTYAGVA
jgi:hypothetical protein